MYKIQNDIINLTEKGDFKMTHSLKDLDEMFDQLFNATQKELDLSIAKNMYTKELVECVALTLHLGYERLKNDK